jgi:hypothetical protein
MYNNSTMKSAKKFLFAAFFALAGTPVFAEGPVISGTLESRVTMNAGKDGGFPVGLEEAANIRLKAGIGEAIDFYGAVNLIAATGTYLAAASAASAASASIPFYVGENFGAMLELERLYFAYKGQAVDLQLGLLRIPFGYDQVFGPADFLNPRNPLTPDARLRAVLGGTLDWYIDDEARLFAFGAGPQNPLSTGDGWRVGIGGERHWDWISLQGLYSYQTPVSGSPGYTPYGLHRTGLSVKADVEVGLNLELLYTYDYDVKTRLEGLSAAFGIDYSFSGFVLMLEYLYNGGASSTAVSALNPAGRQQEHYLYGLAQYLLDDFTTFGAGFLLALEDASASAFVTADWEPLQGLSLSLLALFPLDSEGFTGTGTPGELGPTASGAWANITTAAKLKF